MKIARKVMALLVMTALLCAMTATAAFAAGAGAIWVTAAQKDGTVAQIITDTTVTDGVVKLTYDSTALTYESTEVAEAYVAMYAVNAEEPGTVLISWVAPGAYAVEEEAVCLIQVNFTGTEEKNSVTLTGTAHGVDGNELTFADAPDTTGLAEAIADAQALKKEDYTAESYAALEEAMKEAQEVLADGTATQNQVDEAEAALRDAIKALVKESGGASTEGTEDSGETTKPTTRPGGDTGSNSPTGDSSMIWVVVMIAALSAIGCGVLAIKLKSKKGDDAK